MTDKKESRKRTRASLESLKVTIQNNNTEPDRVRIIQIEPVSKKILLSDLLHHFIVDYSTIIGIHRVADYTARILDNVVFIYLTSAREFRQLLASSQMMLEGRQVNITDPDLISGCARYLVPFAVGAEYDIRNSPTPMSLFGFRQLGTVSTFYVIAVLRALEPQYTTTGFRLAYCDKMRMTRNFGFATFISRYVALQLNEQQFYVMSDRIEVKLPNATPVLIHRSKSHLIHRNRCDLTDEIREANWLHANLADPTLPFHPIVQEAQPESSGNGNHSPIQASSATRDNPLDRPIEYSSGILKTSGQSDSNSTSRRLEGYAVVIRHNTPPASPELSLGEDYELDEEGELHRHKKQRK